MKETDFRENRSPNKWKLLNILYSLRKNRPLQVFLFVFFLSISPVSAQAEFSLGLFPAYNFPLNDEVLQPSPGGALTFEFSPLSWLSVFAQGEYIRLTMENIDPADMFGGSLGLGFSRQVGERTDVGLDLMMGLYSVNRNDQAVSGISAGLRTYGSMKLTPSQSVLVHAGAETLMSNPESFMDSVSIGLGYKVNLTEVIQNITRLAIDLDSQDPVFPVFYSWYGDNEFAVIKITNNEENTIRNVRASFYLEQFMEQETETAVIDSLAPGESVFVPLTAFFNENMLDLTENILTRAQVSVDYTSLGREKREETSISLPVYHRNAMTWEDDRRAAAFVSSKDPAALWFSKYATSIVRDSFREGINKNMQYAMGVVEALSVYGINYVIDPNSSYIELAGSAEAVDFLQYPYQTLMYRGGDCDDLSILACSLLEAIGIDTAFITIPGHIYMAFSLGMSEEVARESFYAPEKLVFHEGKAWVPLEITLADEGFNKAWSVGAKEWNDADERGEARIYPMKSSWMVYQPVSIPGAVSRFNLPEENKTTEAFDESMDSYVEKEIRPKLEAAKARLAEEDSAENRNALGVLYGSYGMLTDAEEQFQIVADERYLHGWTNLGNVAFLRADYNEAMEWYEATLEKEPKNSLALLGMARSYYELEEYSYSDYYYSQLNKYDSELSSQYGYLKSFFDTTGRAWSFSERLATTHWSQEGVSRESMAEAEGGESGLSTMLSFNGSVSPEAPPAEPEPVPEQVVEEPVAEPEPEEPTEEPPVIEEPVLIVEAEPEESTPVEEPTIEPEPAVEEPLPPEPVKDPEPAPVEEKEEPEVRIAAVTPVDPGQPESEPFEESPRFPWLAAISATILAVLTALGLYLRKKRVKIKEGKSHDEKN